jgi:peptidoglycan hydrolase-like protein with peptidoglycan-binding domain
LDAAGFPVGVIDGDFGRRTLFAVLEFQTARFGADADDGIVGPLTGAELGIDAWPVLSDGVAS